MADTVYVYELLFLGHNDLSHSMHPRGVFSSKEKSLAAANHLAQHPDDEYMITRWVLDNPGYGYRTIWDNSAYRIKKNRDYYAEFWPEGIPTK